MNNETTTEVKRHFFTLEANCDDESVGIIDTPNHAKFVITEVEAQRVLDLAKAVKRHGCLKLIQFFGVCWKAEDGEEIRTDLDCMEIYAEDFRFTSTLKHTDTRVYTDTFKHAALAQAFGLPFSEDATPEHCFAVIGRQCGDDEDTCHIYTVATQQAAVEAFHRTMLEDSDIEYDPETYDGAAHEGTRNCIYINHVLQSADAIELNQTIPA